MITLRPARDLDAGALGAMMTLDTHAQSWKPLLHSAAEDIAHVARMTAMGWITVAIDDDETPLGFLAREHEDIHALYVHPDAQGLGVGRALIADAKLHSPRLELWTHQANTAAQTFYSHAGFHEVKRTDGAENEERLPDILYQWLADQKETPNE